MNVIDLDAITNKILTNGPELWLNEIEWKVVKYMMLETAKQTLVLASENAKTKQISSGDIGFLPAFRGTDMKTVVDKQSILDVVNFIK